MMSWSFALYNLCFDFYGSCAKRARSGYREDPSVALVVIPPLAARARNAHDPVIGRSPSPYIRFPPLAARARNAHDPVIGRSPFSLYKVSAFSGSCAKRARSGETLKRHFSQPERVRSWKRRTRRFRPWRIFLDPLDFLHIGNIFPPLAARARNAHEPVIGKNAQVNQVHKKRNISTTKTDRKARVRAPDVSKHFTFI